MNQQSVAQHISKSSLTSVWQLSSELVSGVVTGVFLFNNTEGEADRPFGKMESFGASTKFWALIYCSIVIMNRITKVNSRKAAEKETPENCPQRCKCDEETVNCTNVSFTEIPSNISPNISSLILDGNNFRHLRYASFRNFRRLSNLSM